MIFNGRINLAEEGGTSTFLQDKIPVDSQSNHTNIMGVEDWEKTKLSCAYFSKENIKIIQNAIRAGVYEMSKQQYIIDNQDVDILNTIMRSIFLQYSSNLEENILEQIESLNKLVIDYCVPKLYIEARSYLIFKKDVSTLVIPMSHPTYANHNDKTLHLKHFF
jgi:hypothetical protein